MLILLSLVGLSVGSFLNLCADRLPQGQSVIHPPSHCSTCDRKLGLPDLVPLFSYMWLRGRCRYCHAHISYRLPAVELLTALLFGMAVIWT